MTLHEPLTMALHDSPASLSDELFARPRADPRVLFPHASSRAARGCVWFGCTQHHSLPSPPRAARVEGVVFRLVVNSAMPCLWPLSRVAGNTSLLEPVPRRSVSQPANCTSRQALLCLVSRDRPQWSFLPLPALCQEVVWLSPLRPPGSTPTEAQSLRLFAAVAAAVSCVPRGQRALLDADMLELIDRSACLVELVVVESCTPPVLVLSPQQARPAPRPVAAREFPLREALWKVFCSPGLLIPSCSCRFTATLAPG